uniref:Mas-related G protein-coupled receptor G5 n=1 Tax=Sorex araneus TaxID=42254 RepID=W8W3L1_SORAR|nr:TPA: Mas-related G protein-coupled receptor G5 [Sorex araneus]
MNVTVTPWVTENTLQYESDWEDFERTRNITWLISDIVKLIISLVGLAGNAVVLWLLAFHMQRNAFSVYILNLAGADFVSLSTHMVSSILRLMKYTGLYSNRSVNLIMFLFPYIASLSILSAISTERCLSVLKPIWYRCHRPKHMSSVTCALLWALALLLIILYVGFCDLWFVYTNRYLCDLTAYSIITWPFLSFGLLFGTSLVLLIRLLCGSWKVKLTRLYVTIGLTVLVFLLCGLPWGINHIPLFWESSRLDDRDIIIVSEVLDLLTCVNSCANPIIYFFVGSYRQQRRQQRKSLKVVLQRALQDVPQEGGSQGSPPQETLEMSGNTHVT